MARRHYLDSQFDLPLLWIEYANAYCNSYRYCNGDSHVHPHSNRYSNCDLYSYGYRDRYVHTHSNRNCNRDPNCNDRSYTIPHSNWDSQRHGRFLT